MVEARLRDRRSMTGFEDAVRRWLLRLMLWGLSSSASEADEEGSGAVMTPGVSMRKETDSRISARVEGFFAVVLAVVRRDVAGARMLGFVSWRGCFCLLELSSCAAGKPGGCN